ncbi:hypothetical protein PENTCL1PPCAC_30531, partial [Pristionchus entomophagus]
QMIAHWGYPVESYDVTTEDGYILKLLRIPHPAIYGVSSGNNSSCHRTPILFGHGMLQDASAYLQNPPESSPGMILADAGFDVFLINWRGTFVSQRHVRLSPRDTEYWKFSIDDIAKYDVPATIEKVLALNGAKELYYVGHSMGTLVGFMMLSERPEYNSKVRALFMLGPAGSGHNIKGVTRFGILLGETFPGVIDLIKRFVGPFEFGLNAPWLLAGAARLFCRPFLKLCRDALAFSIGPPAKMYNFSRTPVYWSHLFVSVPSWSTLQLVQNAVHDTINHVDISPEENMRRYGQTTPPTYNYSKIDSDVYLFSSSGDFITTFDEVEKSLRPRMKPGVIK